MTRGRSLAQEMLLDRRLAGARLVHCTRPTQDLAACTNAAYLVGAFLVPPRCVVTITINLRKALLLGVVRDKDLAACTKAAYLVRYLVQ